MYHVPFINLSKLDNLAFFLTAKGFIAFSLVRSSSRLILKSQVVHYFCSLSRLP